MHGTQSKYRTTRGRIDYILERWMICSKRISEAKHQALRSVEENPPDRWVGTRNSDLCSRVMPQALEREGWRGVLEECKNSETRRSQWGKIEKYSWASLLVCFCFVLFSIPSLASAQSFFKLRGDTYLNPIRKGNKSQRPI